MTRMTGPDCVVMCNLINTHTHTHIVIAVVQGFFLPISLGCSLSFVHVAAVWASKLIKPLKLNLVAASTKSRTTATP